MSTKISWCDETINPVVGCSKVSTGCLNCYAEPMARRLAGIKATPQYREVIYPAGPKRGCWNGETAFVPSELLKPFNWKAPRSIFACSMGDLFHDSVPPEWHNQLMHSVHGCPQHTFILLTKRPRRMRAYYTDYKAFYGSMPANLILGVSVEDQATANERIPELLATPAAKRFISLEPMIGPVDLDRIYETGKTENGGTWGSWESCLNGKRFDPWSDGVIEGFPRLDGVILGGESGIKGRRLDAQWAMTVRDQCAAAGVPFMFKQWNYENRNEVDPETGFPFLNGRTYAELAWGLRP